MADPRQTDEFKMYEEHLGQPEKVANFLESTGIKKYPSAKDILSWLSTSKTNPLITKNVLKFIWSEVEERRIVTISQEDENTLLHVEITGPKGNDPNATWQKTLDEKEPIGEITYDKEENKLLVQGKKRLFTIAPDGQIGTTWEQQPKN